MGKRIMLGNAEADKASRRSGGWNDAREQFPEEATMIRNPIFKNMPDEIEVLTKKFCKNPFRY
jgi:hypothetical protein